MKNIIITVVLTLSVFIHSEAKAQTDATTRFLLVRHGETQWNVEGRAQGQTDIPLNEKGLLQAQQTAQGLIANGEIFKTIYSSDLQRALQTAQAIAEAYHMPVYINRALREICWGEAEGLTKEEKEKRFGDALNELNALYPDVKDRWNYAAIPGAETVNEMLTRVKETLFDIASQHPGETVLIVTHSKVIEVLAIDSSDHFLTSIPNSSVAKFYFDHANIEHPLSFDGIESIGIDVNFVASPD